MRGWCVAPCCGSTSLPPSRRRRRTRKLCYLFLQWLGSSRIYSWMTANPGGFFDPFQLSNFSDPLVRQTYHDYHMDIVRESVRRTVPTINYPGATAFHNALDENLVAGADGFDVCGGQAMANTERVSGHGSHGASAKRSWSRRSWPIRPHGPTLSTRAHSTPTRPMLEVSQPASAALPLPGFSPRLLECNSAPCPGPPPSR